MTRTAEYLDFIKTFQWYELKYSTKKSLAELCALITKVRDMSAYKLTGNAHEG